MAAKRKSAKEDDVYYVGISDPINLRRSILESSKFSIQLLKSYELLNVMRSEKAELMAKFEDDMKVLNRLVAKLKSELPKTKFKEALSRAKASAPVKGGKKVLSKQEALP